MTELLTQKLRICKYTYIMDGAFPNIDIAFIFVVSYSFARLVYLIFIIRPINFFTYIFKVHQEETQKKNKNKTKKNYYRYKFNFCRISKFKSDCFI
jgi:hypothetical protein